MQTFENRQHDKSGTYVHGETELPVSEKIEAKEMMLKTIHGIADDVLQNNEGGVVKLGSLKKQVFEILKAQDASAEYDESMVTGEVGSYLKKLCKEGLVDLDKETGALSIHIS
jgi:hypothetical protein